jgi:FAD/FMN-containing dehydrogenase
MIGGGLGTLYSVRGILADSLISAHVVTATGDLVTASQTENADLFWAIRGAGHNFGIITSATFKMYDQTNGGNSVFGDFLIPNSRNASAFELLKSVDEDLEPGVFWGILGGFNHTTKEVNQPSPLQKKLQVKRRRLTGRKCRLSFMFVC